MRLLIPALLVAAFAAVGCQKGKGEEECTGLAELAKSAQSSPSRFDIRVKDVVVSCVEDAYVHLEDGTGAVLVEQKGCGLVTGQAINGPLKGMISSRNGCAVISSLDFGEATLSEAQKIPRTTVTLSQLQEDITPFISRRVRLKGITVDAGIEPGSDMQRSGYISQDGHRMKIFNRSGKAEIATDQFGVLTAYPFRDEYGPLLLIYTSDQFVLDDSEYGRYDFSDDEEPEMLESYVHFNQISIGRGVFRVMNYEEKWATEFSYDPNAIPGSSTTLTIRTLGKGVENSGSVDCDVVSAGGNKIWFRKRGSDTGYMLGTVQQ